MPWIRYSNKHIRQFKNIIGLRVEKVDAVANERLFYMAVQGGFTLIFKGFGRFGNIILQTQNSAENCQIFRQNLQADVKFEFQKSQSENSSVLYMQQHIFMSNSENLPSIFYKENAAATDIGCGLKALDLFADKFIYSVMFLDSKAEQIQKTEKQLKHFIRLKKDNILKAENIKTRRSYKEIGDIIMAYAHTISAGLNSAFLTDFYTGNQIRIKLDKNLNAAENASKYYRKAKNENLELLNTEKLIAESDKNITILTQKLEKLHHAQGFRDLKGNAESKKTESKNLPYKEEIFQDYRIWVGKNAKANDQLLKLCGPNDLWFHVKDYSGSHVVIRKQGSSFPESVIAHAAKLAAQNSRAKSQKVVQVYCIERKFVAKSKRDEAGQVRLLKEKIIDAFLV